MAVRKYNKRLVLAAVNSGAYGQDAIQASTPIAMKTRSTSITPLVAEELTSEYDTGELGNTPSLLTGTHVTFSSEIDVTGSGSPGIAAAWEPFITAAGYVVQPSAGHVDYVKADQNAEQDATFYPNQDGTDHRCAGCRATFTTRIAVGEFATMTFDVMGLFVGIVEQAITSADFSGWQDPVKVGHQNTQLLIGGLPLAMVEFELNENVEISYDENTVDEQIYLTDYSPEGSMFIEADALSAFNPFTIALNHTLQNVRVIHGPAGNQFEVNIPQLQFMPPEYSDRNGRLGYTIPFKVIGKHSYITR